MVLWAPLPLASNRPWAMALLAGWAWVVLMLAVGAAVLLGRRLVLDSWAGGALPQACVAIVGLVAITHAAGLLPAPDRYLAMLYALCAAAFIGALGLCLMAINSRKHAVWLLAMLVLSGVLQAVLGVALEAAGAEYLFFYTDMKHMGRISGSFANPDHLAGYMQLCLAAGIGLLLSQMGGEDHRGGGLKARLAGLLAFVMSRKMVLRVVMVIMVVALVMTHSRAGNVAFFTGLLGTALLVAAVSMPLRRPALWIAGTMIVIDIIIIGQWVGLDTVVNRLKETAQATLVDATDPSQFEGGELPPRKEESLQQRLEVPRLSLPLVAEAPFFGHGAGNYQWVFPRIKPPGFPHYWDHTHNDYIEIAIDVGLVGLGALLAFALTTARRALKFLRHPHSRLTRGVGAAALMALCCMAIHAVVDFNLQIPANALTLTVLLALVWAIPLDGFAPGRTNGTRRDAAGER